MAAEPIATGFWLGRRVLVTGHTGFKGAWLAALLERLGAIVTRAALPPETDDGAFAALSPTWEVATDLVDIRDQEKLASILARAQPEVVFHLAAQAIVRRGFSDPVGTYATNVLGTANVLAAACALPTTRAVVVVTSDKVYANDEMGRPFTESDPLGGNDPYSSSKACAELVVQAWRASFQAGDHAVALGTARAGNVLGGGDQGQDRLVPDIFRALVSGGTLRLRHPLARRPWQFVLDPLWGYVRYAQALLTDPAAPPALNFGPPPGASACVREIVERIHDLWGGGAWEVDEPGRDAEPEAGTLALDSSLARRTLGWSAIVDLDSALRWSCDWARGSLAGDDMAALVDQQLGRYLGRVEPGAGSITGDTLAAPPSR